MAPSPVGLRPFTHARGASFPLFEERAVQLLADYQVTGSARDVAEKHHAVRSGIVPLRRRQPQKTPRRSKQRNSRGKKLPQKLRLLFTPLGSLLMNRHRRTALKRFAATLIEGWDPHGLRAPPQILQE